MVRQIKKVNYHKQSQESHVGRTNLGPDYHYSTPNPQSKTLSFGNKARSSGAVAELESGRSTHITPWRSNVGISSPHIGLCPGFWRRLQAPDVAPHHFDTNKAGNGTAGAAVRYLASVPDLLQLGVVLVLFKPCRLSSSTFRKYKYMSNNLQSFSQI